MALWRNPLIRFVSKHWASMVFVLAMVLSIWASYVSWDNSRENIEQNKLICANVVSNRQSQRFLWDTIVSKFSADPNSASAVEFKRLLNDVLPYLICIDNIPTPVGN